MNLTLQDILLNDSRQLIAALGLDVVSARIEVQCLLQAVLNVNRAHVIAYPEKQLEFDQQARYSALLERRLNGEPVAYILGEREFYGLKFKVTTATLIPRPETELLVERALSCIPREGGIRVLDLGTGSGAIALSIAHVRPDVKVVAIDTSEDALEVAMNNMQNFNLRNVQFLRSDWFSGLKNERFDLIVSNPPYVAEGDAHVEQGDLRFEPRSALTSGKDGLVDISRIIAEAPAHLIQGGSLMFEHGYDQAKKVRELLHQARFEKIFTDHDLSGIERTSGGVWHGH